VDDQIEQAASSEDVVVVLPTEPVSGTAEAGREASRPRDWKLIVTKTFLFLVALFLFILAIQLMKDGAKAIGPQIRGSFPFDNGVSTLGFGWLGAYFVLSGSPVAATSLTLFSTQTLTPLQTFTMLSGSRLGASFIVLLTGFLYSLKNRRARGESIGMGVLALSMTAIVYVPGMLIGYLLLKMGTLDGIQWKASSEVLSVIDYVWGPVLDLFGNNVPGWLLLPIGLAVILTSFKFLDHVLPELDGEKHAASRGHWVKRPWVMFGLGCIVATLTLSVSVALTILVPLASKGYVKRDEALPYIMGANITTLADTLVAAMLLGNAVGVQIVLAEAIGVSIVSLVYLGFFYKPIKKHVIAFEDWLVETNRRLFVFTAGLFVLPVLFLISGLVIGPIVN
jgi:Na+/phosphate symporter